MPLPELPHRRGATSWLGRTCPLTAGEYILFRDSVPSCKTHLSQPDISDRVVSMNAGPMRAAEDMGPMSVKHVSTPGASLRDIATRQ
eukprot:5945971-Amphidinium_carterae.1